MKEKIMKNKLPLKLLFDGILLILLTLMYSKTAISMEFHEIGGLVLFGLFVFHLIFNFRWIVGVTKKLFSKSLPAKTRIGYIVNFLLVVSFALVCISGIFISKTLFQLNAGMIWKTVHYTSASVALVLIGVHVGLHIKMIASFLKKKIKFPILAGKVIGIICLTALLAFGVYSIQSTSIVRWISMPFTTSTMSQSEKMPNSENGAGERQQGERPTDGEGQGAGEGQQGERPTDGEGQGRKAGEHAMQDELNLGNTILVVVQFTSIAAVFAAATFGLETLLNRKKRKGKALTQ